MHIDLIQPRHTYATPMSSGEPGQIYTNTSLRTIWALLHNHNGQTVTIHDENIQPASIHGDIVGINLLWAPYIPEAQKLIARIREEVWRDMQFIIGGQVARPGSRGLTSAQRQQLFWPWVYNGMDPAQLMQLGLWWSSSQVQASLVPIYEMLPDDLFLRYFTHEISFYLSQWCNQHCSFCAAEKGQKETYRDHHVIHTDMTYIVERLERCGVHHLSAYLTNLDVFQTPGMLIVFTGIIEEIKRSHPSFSFSFRWLAWVSFFMKLHEKHSEILRKLREIGFNTVWYGIDGVWPEVRKGIKKPQNNEKNTLDALHLTRTEYDMTPELLMVFGHDGIDTKKTLEDAYIFTEEMVSRYNAAPRPHIAKPFIPGNDGWNDPRFQDKVNNIMHDPSLFQSLDFTAMASDVTHHSPALIKLANEYYYRMCLLPGNTTQPIIAYNTADSARLKQQKDAMNRGKFDR